MNKIKLPNEMIQEEWSKMMEEDHPIPVKVLREKKNTSSTIHSQGECPTKQVKLPNEMTNEEWDKLMSSIYRTSKILKSREKKDLTSITQSKEKNQIKRPKLPNLMTDEDWDKMMEEDHPIPVKVLREKKD